MMTLLAYKIGYVFLAIMKLHAEITLPALTMNALPLLSVHMLEIMKNYVNGGSVMSLSLTGTMKQKWRV